MFIKNLYNLVRDYINTQRARDTLSCMDNRMLADIGISRSDIDYVVKTNDRSKTNLYV